MNRHTLGTLVCLGLAVPLAWLLLERRAGARVPVVRVATFNVALNRPTAGALLAELRGGACAPARALAEIVQRTAPDVLLLNEIDRDADGAAANVFAREYLAVGQNGQPPIDYAFIHVPPVNTGEPTGLDLDRDGRTDGPGDAYGYGAFPGQYGMAILSRHPILTDRIRSFRTLRWAAMPGAQRPAGYYDDATWQRLRLSSKNHVDVPIGIGAQVVHLLASHPTPPVFDGPEDRNGCRNHDEIRFWVDYLTPERADWIVDDAGVAGGLPADAAFVLLGDLNADPADGARRVEALQALLAHPRVQDPRPQSRGGLDAARAQFGTNGKHAGDAALDTGDFPDAPPHDPGNLRVDYVLPARSLPVAGCGVFWPPAHDPLHARVAVSDHRLVFVDLAMR